MTTTPSPEDLYADGWTTINASDVKPGFLLLAHGELVHVVDIVTNVNDYVYVTCGPRTFVYCPSEAVITAR